MSEKQHDLAIPDRAVAKYRALTGYDGLSAEEVRTDIRAGVSIGWNAREVLTQKFGHEGYGVPSNDNLYFILNPDRMTDHEFVVMSVYTKEQFQARQKGEFFRDLSFSAPLLTERVGNAIKNSLPALIYRVECSGEETLSFDTEEDVLRYLSALADKGKTQKDWTVWKKVKTTITMEQS